MVYIKIIITEGFHKFKNIFLFLKGEIYKDLVFNHGASTIIEDWDNRRKYRLVKMMPVKTDRKISAGKMPDYIAGKGIRSGGGDFFIKGVLMAYTD